MRLELNPKTSPAPAAPQAAARRRRRWWTWPLRGLGALGLLILLALAIAWGALWASLADLSGARRLPGLTQAVQVERDALGIPTIRARHPLDLARAVGFVHAQDRFFQMDLLRRSAAGELAALFGPAALPMDRQRRLHRMRPVAREILAGLSAPDRAQLEAYAAGANAGLDALGSRPPEYWVLRQKPAPWKAEDCLLVIHAMAFDLQDADGNAEHHLGTVQRALGNVAFEFYFPRGTEWEAPLDDSRTPAPRMPEPGEFSAPEDPGTGPGSPPSLRPKAGSNAWAVHGRRTVSGAALVADDMHLGLQLPNIWYRLSLIWTEPSRGARTNRVTGVSLPGVPAVVAGSTDRIAWGFTNATIDNSDVIDLELNPADPGQYRVPGGWERFRVQREVLEVAGAPPETLEFPTTRWGPVLYYESRRPAQAVRWVFHDPDAVDLLLLELPWATNVAQALALASRAGIPAQNFVVGDRDGHIGWTLTGHLPNRVGSETRLPDSWADGTRRWEGWIEATDHPRVMDPPEGILWTANQRVLGTVAYQRAGDGDFDLGARARQIRDRLRALDRADVLDMLQIQLDDEARFLERWQALLLETLQKTPGLQASPRDLEARRMVEQWGRAASTHSVGYLLVRSFRLQTLRSLLEPVREQSRRGGAATEVWSEHQEGPAWTLLERRPAHLLSRRFRDYDALLAEAARATLQSFDRPDVPLAQWTWGQRNTVRIQHPFSQVVPALARFLDLPPQALPGDRDMPRAQGRNFGASERFGVSPGFEAAGYCHMPGGQSGHFLSPFYRAGHRAWAEGKPLPFLPGPAQYRLSLLP